MKENNNYNDKTKKQPAKDFNTGSHTPSSLKNAGSGYDDTGKGKYEKKKMNWIKNNLQLE